MVKGVLLPAEYHHALTHLNKTQLSLYLDYSLTLLNVTLKISVLLMFHDKLMDVLLSYRYVFFI